MSPNLRIAFRFLTAKKRAMAMSLSCIVLGVGLFAVTQATTTGFEEFFIRTILGTNGALRVEDKIEDTIRSMEVGTGPESFKFESDEGRKYIEGIPEPKRLITALQQFDNVAGVSEVLTGNAFAKSDFKNESVKVYGIRVDDHLRVSDLGRQIVEGSLADFRGTPNGIIIGKELSRRIQSNVGDWIILEAQQQQRRYRVVAVYETGVTDVDRVRVYMNMGEARSLLKKINGASFLQISLYDKDRAPRDAERMEAVLRHSANSWQKREKTWLSVFRALRISTGITVSVFTLIAGLAMFNTLAMIVIEKTKDIAILRSMGYTREDITRIFLWQAIIVLVIGCVLGCALGAGITYTVSKVPIHIRGIFATDTFIVAWSVWHYVSAVLISVVMVMIASLVPARRAARLEPGDVIRGTAT